MKKKIRIVLLVLVAVVCVGSAVRALMQLYDYEAAKKLYDQAIDMVMQNVNTSLMPDFPPLPSGLLQEPLEEKAHFLMQMDLEELRKTNQDVLGWIHIPDSPVSYPLMRVKDNQEYLRRAWDGSPNQAGCIFLECKNKQDFSHFNSIIFGHYMNNGTMFGSLHNYKQQEYWDSHPYIYIVTDDMVRRYEVFASYEAGVESDTYWLYFENEAHTQSALEYYMDSSVIKSDVVPTVEDLILTLSTCVGNGTYHSRWVVQAVLTGEFPRT